MINYLVTWQDALPILVSLVTVGTAVAGVVFALCRGVARIAKSVSSEVVKPLEERLMRLELTTGVLSVKVDTIWSALMRRAEASAIISGMATRNSPLTFGDDELTWMGDLAGPLRETFEAEWSHLDDDDLCLEIERRFGPEIQTQVCIPHHISDGRCLLIACAVARGAGPPK